MVFTVVAPVSDTGVTPAMDGRPRAIVISESCEAGQGNPLNKGPARSTTLRRLGLLVIEHKVEDGFAHLGLRAVRGLVVELDAKAAPNCKKVETSQTRTHHKVSASICSTDSAILAPCSCVVRLEY